LKEKVNRKKLRGLEIVVVVVVGEDVAATGKVAIIATSGD
jgi:hypothetical protein